MSADDTREVLIRLVGSHPDPGLRRGAATACPCGEWVPSGLWHLHIGNVLASYVAAVVAEKDAEVVKRIRDEAIESIDKAHLSRDRVALVEATMRYWWSEAEKNRRALAAATALVDEKDEQIERQASLIHAIVAIVPGLAVGSEQAIADLRTLLAPMSGVDHSHAEVWEVGTIQETDDGEVSRCLTCGVGVRRGRYDQPWENVPVSGAVKDDSCNACGVSLTTPVIGTYIECDNEEDHAASVSSTAATITAEQSREDLAALLGTQEWPDLTWDYIKNHCQVSRFYDRADTILTSTWLKDFLKQTIRNNTPTHR